MKKKYRYLLLLIVVIPLLLVFFCNYVVEKSAEGKTFYTIKNLKKNKVGLVLGTAKKLTDGRPNPYYTNRIKAAIQLYKSGKVAYILVSGDNSSRYYNEPTTFKKDLVAGGIPEDKIFLDFAGFRTLDSMVRAKEIFGQESVTVISQKFHNERAIYLAEHKGLKAIGYNAEDVKGKEGVKIRFREYFARVKVFIDLVMNTQPKFYGEKIEIK
ncbi:MAG: ElyC/SanA/YdcF family protein [Bacteroidota bacterium]